MFLFCVLDMTYLNFHCGVCLLISTVLRFLYIRKCNNQNRISVKNTFLSWHGLSCCFSRLEPLEPLHPAHLLSNKRVDVVILR